MSDWENEDQQVDLGPDSESVPDQDYELSESIERLVNIKDEMLELLGEAQDLLTSTSHLATIGPSILDRAEAYWLAHIRVALSNDHDYLGESMCSMEDTIKELDAESNQEDADDV